MSARVRFAPSPTGYLHVGGARTALYNWLVARQTGGVLILRSDDTDAERSTPEYQEDIVGSMRWLGLDWGEGIEVDGPYAPYRQSLRYDRYNEAIDHMLETDAAYRCFCTPAELDERRKQAQADGRPPGYDGRCRHLSAEESASRLGSGDPASVRLAVPRPGETVFVDLVRGEMGFDHEHVDDFVLQRWDGSPTYHMASSVDDVDFGITHVIRGEDLLSSTPKHILIGNAVGDDPGITYAHLSLLRGPDGSKLSKRHGDTAVKAYRDAGYLPEALLNYLALLGWSPGDDETIVSLSGMIERFDLGAVTSSPAVFDAAKLEWMNGVYVRELPIDDFVARTRPLLEADLGRELTEQEAVAFAQMAPLVQERAKLLTEVAPQLGFLFNDPISYDEASWSKVMTTAEARASVEGAASRLDEIEPFTAEVIETALRAMLDELGLSAKKGLQPLRVAATGSSVSPPLFESLEALGKERTLARLRDAFTRL